jgi:hypothetical protein
VIEQRKHTVNPRQNIQNSFTGQNPAPSVSGSPLLTLDAFELQHDPQRGRDLSHILLAFSGAFEQAGKLAPGELRAVFLGQVFLDQESGGRRASQAP